jgi:ribosomal protein L37E
VTKRKNKYDVNVFYCKRCGRQTTNISFTNVSVLSKYCNSCRYGLAENGTGNLIEFPFRDSDGKINFNHEKYEIKREFEHLGLRYKNKKDRKVYKPYTHI